LPRLGCTFREAIAILEAHGFELHTHKSSSHRKYRNAEPRYVTIAAHDLGDVIPIGTLKSIIRQSGLPQNLFRK
jgi:predicted RNA binding protein YcfA (HicA-like mRNA interferase family)